MVQFFSGVAGARGSNPLGVVIHNDAASQGATVSYYKNWLPSHNAELGFAHYYVCSDGTLQVEYEENMAWHTANSNGNANYIGIEACQSMGNEATFRTNESNSIKLAADILKRYGLAANRTTVKLHKQFSSTACPHRSVALHGDDLVMQDYFISEINKVLSGSSTTNSNTQKTEPTKKTKEGNVMLLFKENGRVYWVVGNEYTYIKNPKDLSSVKTMMTQAGYDTHEHTSATQIAYLKKLATEKK